MFPEGLLPAEREAARRLLGSAGPLRQVLLDELAGRMRAQGVRSPLAYLRGLVQRADAGRFVPELAPRVAAERLRRGREAEARQERALEEQRRLAARTDPDALARERERRERISAHLDALRQRLGMVPRKRDLADGDPDASNPS